MFIPEYIRKFAQIVDQVGGHAYVVGGAVRDYAMGISPHDYDIEVSGLDVQALASLPYTHMVPAGDRYGVYLVTFQGITLEVALPQTRVRTGAGHRGEIAIIDHTLPIDKSLARRDYTMNAMAWDINNEALIDPFDGLGDIEDSRLRCIDPVNFALDPLRVLRGMQFCARFDLVADRVTLNAAQDHVRLFNTLSPERIRGEWDKWASAPFPAAGIRFLVDCGWIECFPVLARLAYVEQDRRYHPEGDVLAHTILALQALGGQVADPVVSFAVLLHDIGKVSVDRNHAETGAGMVVGFFRSIGWNIQNNVPQAVQAVQALVNNHMWAMSFDGMPSASAVRRLANRLSPASMRQWAQVCIADRLGRGAFRYPAVSPVNVDADVDRVVAIAEMAGSMQVLEVAPQALVMGRHLVDLGYRPGPAFGSMLSAAFDAQLDGAFDNVVDGIAWIVNNFGG